MYLCTYKQRRKKSTYVVIYFFCADFTFLDLHGFSRFRCLYYYNNEDTPIATVLRFKLTVFYCVLLLMLLGARKINCFFFPPPLRLLQQGPSPPCSQFLGRQSRQVFFLIPRTSMPASRKNYCRQVVFLFPCEYSCVT